MQKIKRNETLVSYEGKLYVKKPTSWSGGWARSIILERALGQKITIAPEAEWQKMCKEGTLMRYLEFEDGTFRID